MSEKFFNRSSWTLCKRTHFRRDHVSGAIGQRVSGNIEVDIKAYIPSRIGINILLTVPFLQKNDGWVYDIIFLNMSYNGLHDTNNKKTKDHQRGQKTALYISYGSYNHTQRKMTSIAGVREGTNQAHENMMATLGLSAGLTSHSIAW